MSKTIWFLRLETSKLEDKGKLKLRTTFGWWREQILQWQWVISGDGLKIALGSMILPCQRFTSGSSFYNTY